MKIKKLHEFQFAQNVTSYTLDNIFDATYQDYLVVVTYLDGPPNLAIRVLDISGNEKSTTTYYANQIRQGGTGPFYQLSNNSSSYSDAFWKYSNNTMIGYISSPYDGSRGTTFSSIGMTSSGATKIDTSYWYKTAQQIRGLKFLQYNTSTYWSAGTCQIFGVEET